MEIALHHVYFSSSILKVLGLHKSSGKLFMEKQQVDDENYLLHCQTQRLLASVSQDM